MRFEERNVYVCAPGTKRNVYVCAPGTKRK